MTAAQKMLDRLEEIRPSSEHPIIAGENISEVFEQLDETIDVLQQALQFIIRETWKPQ